ncbi:M20/M25/M40 family metallo-hydrolase [Sphingomonas sp. RB1R13]|uniref:M20/M25/M40 family metallo-hydrolase n=1 Tax=Sphingomonas sp. RB1R13 TaxID=3096159 RepID=UPI002FCA2C4A
MRGWMLAGVAAMMASGAMAEPPETARIIDEGLNRSQLMTNASQLMDGIGGRLTNSPSLRRAETWAMGKFSGYGLANVHKEAFDFGRGWELISRSGRLVEPRSRPLMLIPVAWTAPTNGVISAPIVVAPMSKPENFEAWKGKLAGKIVLISLPGTTDEAKEGAFKRYSDGDIHDLDKYDLPSFDPDRAALRAKRRGFSLKLDAFLKAEGAVAWIKRGYRDNGLVSGEGYDYAVGTSPSLPGFDMAGEDYRLLARLAVTGANPVVELSSNVRFDDSDRNAHNIIAEIPGRDAKAGYVMAGGHFDSWIAGDGASDNGAGSVVVIEAARILRSLGVAPKRTIRFALWEGEEQGLLGSRAYIEQHLAARPLPPGLTGIEAYSAWSNAYPITKKPGYDALKAYFNMDNGSGKLRGLYAEQNGAAAPLLKEWLSPFASMGAGSVVTSKTGGTDHVFLQAIGIQGYQFIQDPLDYESRVHHSNLDTLDHMRPDDLRQAAVVLAGVLWAAANSDKELPRPPLPSRPVVTDPFRVADPNE